MNYLAPRRSLVNYLAPRGQTPRRPKAQGNADLAKTQRRGICCLLRKFLRIGGAFHYGDRFFPSRYGIGFPGVGLVRT